VPNAPHTARQPRWTRKLAPNCAPIVHSEIETDQRDRHKKSAIPPLDLGLPSDESQIDAPTDLIFIVKLFLRRPCPRRPLVCREPIALRSDFVIRAQYSEASQRHHLTSRAGSGMAVARSGEANLLRVCPVPQTWRQSPQSRPDHENSAIACVDLGRTSLFRGITDRLSKDLHQSRRRRAQDEYFAPGVAETHPCITTARSTKVATGARSLS
jgi:hypothetical protein